MNTEHIQKILENIKKVKVAVLGDFCLDAYWILSPDGGEISVETGQETSAVRKHYYTLGGASNIVANLAALAPEKIYVIGCIGQDIFGRELIRQLKQLNVNCDGIITQPDNYDTVTFGKPILGKNEQTRIDFGFFNIKSQETLQLLASYTEKILDEVDVLIVNQQVPGSLDNESFIEMLNKIFGKQPSKKIILDSRHYTGKFRNVILKINAVEAARLNGINASYQDIIHLDDAKKYAMTLYKKHNRPCFITRGSRGIIVADKGQLNEIPGVQIINKTDTVGCGDTTVSTIALVMGAGFSPIDAATTANIAASITAQKLYQTGTANVDEITKTAQNINYVYQPELAEDQRKSVFKSDMEIEICYPQNEPKIGQIKHAVFDHDGTISVLRQGWEHIMEPVMIHAILGEKFKTADENTYHKVKNRVKEYIDKSTGIETVKQMQSLIEIVKEFGFIPNDQILDKWGYKKIYNDALMDMVNKRIQKFSNQELSVDDFLIKGSVDFLKMLKKRNVRLYLASGTDYDDVLREAKTLDYADLFDGGIYGAVGDSENFSQKTVIKNIMTENNLHGSELLVVGDGPVEMRECRKRDGIALGIASDEVRRYGLSPEKRSRLIKAGAHYIVPDFSQFDKLAYLLFNS